MNETPGFRETARVAARVQTSPQTPQNTRIKICGLFRIEDICYANEARPDYVGFVFAESKRRVTAGQARKLRERLDAGITPVGVFVNSGIAEIAALVNDGVIDMVQLHGGETAAYITRLREACAANIIKAVIIGNEAQSPESALSPKEAGGADYLLLDGGTGSGKTFDWRIAGQIAADCGFADSFFLAGGIHPDNIGDAVALRPFAVDVSSGAETGGVKDREKMLTLVAACRA